MNIIVLSLLWDQIVMCVSKGQVMLLLISYPKP